MNEKMIIAIGVGVMAGPMFAIFVTPIFVLLKIMFYTPFMQNKYLKQAIDKGHVVEAKLVKSHDVYSHGEEGHSWTGKVRGAYVYEYNGKSYRYSAVTRGRLPESKTLYFLKNPRKASAKNGIGYKEVGWFKSYLIVSFLMVIAISMIGAMYFGI